LAHDSWERGSQVKWRNYRKGVLRYFTCRTLSPSIWARRSFSQQ
jgi:hypothetical protein